MKLTSSIIIKRKMKVYHEEYGYGTLVQRHEWMGVAQVLFTDAHRIVLLEDLDYVV